MGGASEGIGYSLTPEQEMLRQVIPEFATKELVPRAEDIEETGTPPREVYRGLVDLGVIGMPYPEAYGGGGADLLTTVIAVEELARACANTAMIPATQELAATPIVVAGSPEQRRDSCRPSPQAASGCRSPSPSRMPGPMWRPCAQGPFARRSATTS